VKFLKNSQVARGQSLRQPPERNLPKATRRRSVSARDAPGLCSKTWSMELSRSCGARNRPEPHPATQRAAACGDGALGSCKGRPRNSPRPAPRARRQTAARTKVKRPAGKGMQRRYERAFASDYSQKGDTIPIVPHLDASPRASIAKRGEPSSRQKTAPCARSCERPQLPCLDLLAPGVAD
jgi:hypothetical protein